MKIRAFIALQLDESLRTDLAARLAPLRDLGADVGWVRPENLHLTLKFLGPVDAGTVPALAARLGIAAGVHAPFSLTLSGTGVFPDTRRPRVIWVGLTDGDGIQGLVRDVETAMEKEGFPRETRPFSPHITLGRVRSPRGIAKLMPELVKYSAQVFGTQRVDCLYLMESTLRPGGAEYTVLHRAPLRRTD